MTNAAGDIDVKRDFRRRVRSRFLDMLLSEYKARKESGELLYKGRWISQSDKIDFLEELQKEHRALFHDTLVLLGVGFVLAVILIIIIKSYFFPV